jgi:hypothetical protein
MLGDVTAKQEALSLLEKLPDNCSIEEHPVPPLRAGEGEGGLEDARKNGAISQEDAESRLSKWL